MAGNIPFAGGHIPFPKRKILIRHGMVLGMIKRWKNIKLYNFNKKVYNFIFIKDAIIINENLIGVRDAGNPVEILLEENEEVIKATYGRASMGELDKNNFEIHNFGKKYNFFKLEFLISLFYFIRSNSLV